MHSSGVKVMGSTGLETVLLEGAGLFSGIRARVRLSRAEGALWLVVGGREAAFDALRPVAEGRTSGVAGEGLRLSCVEHLFAAVAAFGIRSGLRIESDVEELPLLDGGAMEWSRALRALGFGSDPSPPRLRVARNGTIRVRATQSEYVFDMGSDASCEVFFDTEDSRLTATASWKGGVEEFEHRVATARTFVEERELASMLAQGYRATVDPESVVVLGASVVHAAGRPFEADEPARHKLLDLIGDLALHGGPPLGCVKAHRPGHAATHEAMAQASAQGIVTASP